jgi:hypothetical protein
MRLVVPALSADNVAARCLRAEGLQPEVVLLGDDHAYARLISELWRGGETFVVVEDDIAPWPGAINALLTCSHHWCGHYYCLPGRWDIHAEPDEPGSLWGTTGCYKVSGDVLAAAPDLYRRFEQHDWQTLDIGFITSLRHVLGLESMPMERTFHVHEPPVAHAMHYRPEAFHGRAEAVQLEHV